MFSNLFWSLQLGYIKGQLDVPLSYVYYHGIDIVYNLGILGDNLPINTHYIG